MSTMKIHTDIGSVITSLELTEADARMLQHFLNRAREEDGEKIALLTVPEDPGVWSLGPEGGGIVRYMYPLQNSSKPVEEWRAHSIPKGLIRRVAGDAWDQALSSLRVGEGKSVHGMEGYPTLPMQVVNALSTAVALTRREAWVDSKGGAEKVNEKDMTERYNYYVRKIWSSTTDDVPKPVTEWLYKAVNSPSIDRSSINFYQSLSQASENLFLGPDAAKALNEHDKSTRAQDGTHLSYMAIEGHPEGYWTLAVDPTKCTIRYHTNAKGKWMDKAVHIWTSKKPWSSKVNEIKSKVIGDAVSATIAGMKFALADDKEGKSGLFKAAQEEFKTRHWNRKNDGAFAFHWLTSTNKDLYSTLAFPFEADAPSAAARGSPPSAKATTQPQVAKAGGPNADGTTADPQEATVCWKQGRREEWLADLKAWEGGKFASAANLEPLANALGTQDTFTWSPEQPDICFSVSPSKIDGSEQVMNVMAWKLDAQGNCHRSKVQHPVGPSEQRAVVTVLEKWVEAEDKNISQMEKRNELTTEVYEQSQQQFAFLSRALPHLPQETSMGVAGLPDEDPVFGTGGLADALTQTEDALEGVKRKLQAAEDTLRGYQRQTDAFVKALTRYLTAATSVVESYDGEEHRSDPE